ncbi:2Fe-2S iron-sulfur cluster-binding protein [Streptomyces sp. NPDC048603]|uniref:2Fe-2S iron-sulfur cluster-binding protein n=1 Tax=Streptomyces sp. NPDC048603 TaxID=3365577 RepID=UPI003720D129
MPKITYLATDRSNETTLDLPVGTSIMRGAISNDLDGIVGQCGGYAQCATCHVYVEPEGLGKLAEPELEEDEMLEFTACGRESNSRLSCQLTVTDELDGLVVRLPERQCQ